MAGAAEAKAIGAVVAVLAIRALALLVFRKLKANPRCAMAPWTEGKNAVQKVLRAVVEPTRNRPNRLLRSSLSKAANLHQKDEQLAPKRAISVAAETVISKIK
jgi:hypothetical protein